MAVSDTSIPLVAEAERIKREPRTEAEARAEGHTPTPWEFRHQSPREVALKRPHFEIGAPHGKGVGIIFLTQDGTEADAHFVKLAVNSYDAMKAMLETARSAIASLPEDALGIFEQIEPSNAPDLPDDVMAWPIRDELLSAIDKALAAARGERA